MSKKIILACMALGAFVAFAIIPASASAVRLCETTENHECHNVAVGEKITGHLVGGTTSKFTGSGGVNVECSSADLTGTLTKNNGTEVEGTIETASFTGTSGTGTECSSGLGPVNVTTGGANGVPYCVKALPGATMEGTVRGNSCANAARALTFILDVTTIFGTVECKYERTTATGPVKGNYTTDDPAAGEESDAIIHVSAQVFAGEAGNPGTCPASGSLDMSITLVTDTPGEGTLYFAT